METVWLVKINDKVIAVVSDERVAREYTDIDYMVTAEQWLVRHDSKNLGPGACA